MSWMSYNKMSLEMMGLGVGQLFRFIQNLYFFVNSPPTTPMMPPIISS